MVFFESLLVALSTYSAIPTPQFEWNERNMKYSFCFWPVVGVLVGLLLWGWTALAQALGLSSLLFAAVACCLPLLLTGGIHMDGYMDTCDALASHQTRERKLEIMKDPNCGAFAVIYCAVYLMVQFGMLAQLYELGGAVWLCPGYVLSRACGALCGVTLPKARKSGMLTAYTKDNATKVTVTVMALVILAAGAFALWLSPVAGGMALAFTAVTVLSYRSMALRLFGGVTGDTSGFCVQLCELLFLAGALVGGLLV